MGTDPLAEGQVWARGSAPADLVDGPLDADRRVLLLGASGTGKSTLAAGLAAELRRRGRAISGIAADPGSPGFGVPGAVSLGRWGQDGWETIRIGPLCTLDAGRFRQPLIQAAARLSGDPEPAILLVDGPGLVRGVAGAELLDGLVRSCALDLILVLVRGDEPPPMAAELAALGIQWVRVRSSPLARSPGKSSRARARTKRWDAYLAEGVEHWVPIDRLILVGTPPRLAPDAWAGKQIAFPEGSGGGGLGEVLDLEDGVLRLRLPLGVGPGPVLLVRDAGRGPDGLLISAKPFGADLVRQIPPPDLLPEAGPRPVAGTRALVHAGYAIATLANGVFEDPLMHLRLRHRRRSLLFDLGDGARLPARIAHQVTDCFLSHAHADHIGGFLWLLRSRIGESATCRIYGPPGIARHIQGFVSGILWDRIRDRGPVFEIAELHGERLLRWRLQAGQGGPVPLDECPAELGLLLDDPGFRVQACCLDHGTPVLAFAFEPTAQVRIVPERLAALGLAPGPWLTGLKQRILKGQYDSELELPNGGLRRVADLAGDLALSEPGARVVYATDLADTPENRRRLIDLASGAHALFCESPFLERDREQARRTGHLTARACGEIGAAAGVSFLIPFHFSRRYEHEPWRVYAEVAAACPQTLVPKQGGIDSA